jgi:tRNA threonylcarbamoyladenosine biosynthesis protein TsaE
MQIFQQQCNQPQMVDIAKRLAVLLKAGDCLTFHGNLGAGKTAFIRAIIQTLADAENVPSPTFTLVQTYDSVVASLWHFDLYRLKQPEELYELGFEEALINSILFIEWPERAKGLLPVHQLQLHLEHAPQSDARILTITGGAEWASRLTPLKQN